LNGINLLPLIPLPSLREKKIRFLEGERHAKNQVSLAGSIVPLA
jgi:hypothetical protein